MNAPDKKFLATLLDTPSPTGFETRGQSVWRQYVKKYADKVDSDTYGTTWAVLKGKKSGSKTAKTRTIMLEAHADEIGYMVKYITKDGFLHIDIIGGSDAATARGKRIVLLGDKGEVPGIIGNTAIHIRDREGGEKAPKINELYVDIGAKDDKEVAKMGIRVGHPAVYCDALTTIGKGKIVSRALDNRMGGFIIAQVIRRLSQAKTKPECTVYAVNAIQEEIGGYGAKMITHHLEPDLAIVLDVTHATDTPGIDKTKHGETLLGKGPAITHGKANHPVVVKRIMDVSKKKKIKLQHEASSRYSGTDTDAVYHVQEGTPSALVSLPLRYMHSTVEMVDEKDVEKTIDLLVALIQSISVTDDFRVKIK